MSKLETGVQEPSAHQVALVARALGVRAGELYGDAPSTEVIATVVSAALSGSPESIRERLTEALAVLTAAKGP